MLCYYWITRGGEYMATNDDSIKKNISKNITKCREGAGLSQKELALLLNVTPSRVSNWEQGANCPTIDMLFKLCKILNVSINDVYGVYPDSNMQLQYDEMKHIEKYRALDQFGQETVSYILDRELKRIEQINTARNKQQSKLIQPTCFMPYYQKLASAGNGEYLFSDIPTNTIEVPVNDLSAKADFVIGVNGDSMEPTFSDGDKVYVEKAQIVEIGEIGIFMLNNECFIKEAGSDGLISHNPKYDMIPGTDSIQCIGKVLGKLSPTAEDLEAIRLALREKDNEHMIEKSHA